MISFTKHIEIVRQQPHHIRKQIALTSAGVITAIIAIAWLTGSLATGTFALKGTSFADATNGTLPKTASAPAGFGSLIGAASAAIYGEPEGPSHIEIVDTGNSSTFDANKTAPTAEPTTIPF
jgi:hypothetical protein